MRKIIQIIIVLMLVGYIVFLTHQVKQTQDKVEELQQKLEEQIYINESINKAYETLRVNYDDLDIDLHQQIKVCEEKEGK